MAACIDKSRNHVTSSFMSDDHGCKINSHLCKLIRLCGATVSIPSKHKLDHDKEEDPIWMKIQVDALVEIRKEPILSNYFFSSILSHCSLESALANQLAIKFSNSSLSSEVLFQVFSEALRKDSEITTAIRDDLRAIKDRDPACTSYLHCFLNLKGFFACQAHRLSHKLWLQGRTALSLLIQSRISEVFAVDIHPGAKLGHGILLDHATGIVIGETAVIGDNVTILHNVTLGGTGKDVGDRHPKIGDGVSIGAGAKILGNVKIGEGAKIGAEAVVLKDVPPRATVVGNPARVIVAKS